MVRVLSLLLRLAENLDRTHDRRVKKAEFVRKEDNIALSVTCTADCSLEIWAVESEKDSFFRTFRTKLVIEQKKECQDTRITLQAASPPRDPEPHS
jgi:exopolyphosphatase/guanosine-5'-triphosphate,3'-diphosphate pyrophosphatase